MSKLFRPEAIEYNRRRLQGDVLLMTPIPFRIMMGVLVSILLIGVIFAACGTYSRKESVQGWIIPQGGIIRVLGRQGGVIEHLAVAEGDEIKAGAEVARLRLTDSVGGVDSGQAMKASLELEEAASKAQLRAATARLEAARTGLQTQRLTYASELIEERARVENLIERQRLADANYKRAAGLVSKGILSPMAAENILADSLAAAQSTSQARSAVLATQRQIKDIDRQLSQIPNDLASASAQAAQVDAALAQKRISLSAQSVYSILSPVAGKIIALPAEQGQTSRPGSTVAVIAPHNAELVAEMFVPTRAVGFIGPGQSVKLMYDAFPYQKFGVGRGVIKSVSRTVLAPGEGGIPGTDFKEPMFRVRATLSQEGVPAYGRMAPLQPGMLLSADIVIDRRSLLEWLLDPLYAVGRRS